MTNYLYSIHFSLCHLYSCCVHRAGKALTKGLKTRALVAGTLGAVALSSALGGYAKADEGVEGSVKLYYSLDGFGQAWTGVFAFIEGGSEDWDVLDIRYYPMFGPEQTFDLKLTTQHGGYEAMCACYPPISGSREQTFTAGVVMEPLATTIPIVDNAQHGVTVGIMLLDNCEVFVNGIDVRQQNYIPLGTFSGKLTDLSASVTVSVRYLGAVEPPEPPVDPNNWTPWDPNTPDPNTPVTPADPNAFVPAKNPDPSWGKEDPRSIRGFRNFDPNNTLFISNVVDGYIPQGPRALALWLAPGSTDLLDSRDLTQGVLTSFGVDPLIYSFTKASAKSTKIYNVKVDARDPTSANLDFPVCLSFDTASGSVVNLEKPRENCLSFAYPVASMKDPNNPDRFYGKSPVFWVDDIDSPLWSVERLIRQNNGVFLLPKTQKTYVPEEPYFKGVVSFTRPLGDVVRDGKVDALDYNSVASFLGFEGATAADVGGTLGMGMPDGVVDSRDLEQLYSLLPAAEKAKVVAPATGAGSKPPASAGTSVEGFESGVFKAGWSTSVSMGWRIVAQQRHSGTLSAQSGQIGDDQTTSLTLIAQCTGGEIRFWRKISTEPNWDNYTFSINGKQMEKLSGEKDWQQVSFPVTAGSNSFEWSYSKDGSSSQGEDAVWIDDVEVPVGS